MLNETLQIAQEAFEDHFDPMDRDELDAINAKRKEDFIRMYSDAMQVLKDYGWIDDDEIATYIERGSMPDGSTGVVWAIIGELKLLAKMKLDEKSWSESELHQIWFKFNRPSRNHMINQIVGSEEVDVDKLVAMARSNDNDKAFLLEPYDGS